MTKPKVPVAPPAPIPVATVSRETLEETPARVLPFLRAIGTARPIRALMAARGYTADDHKQGWTLLHAVSGFIEGAPLETVDVKVRDAIAAIDAWDEDGFRVVRAALGRQHPAQAGFVLDGIGASVGPAAVVGVKKLLERLDALENGADRKASRKEDHAALATLAQRGIDAKERARLAGLVKAAESISDAPAEEDAAARVERDGAYVAGLIALRAWYEDWSEMARVAVKRRDYLIRMGLAKRKAPKKAKEGAPAPADAGMMPAGGAKSPA